MSIWFAPVTLEAVKQFSETNMITHLGIEFTEIGDDYIKAKMPVDHRTHQPVGLLHGGASVVLAESLGSTGAFLSVDPSKKSCVGIEINANHVRGVREGYVEGITRPIHLGRSTQVWETRIFNEAGKIVCISRITIAVIDLPKK